MSVGSQAMLRKKNIFTTYGTLRACIIEVVDLVEATQLNAKKLKGTKNNVFAMLKTVDENGTVISHYNSDTHICYVAETLIIGEEFIFENISSAHNLVVYFYSVSLEKEKNQSHLNATQTCLGYTQIPLSRLEENVAVMQWHQLFSSTMEGLRSAVKIECNFTSDTVLNNKNSSAIIRRTASTTRHGSEYNASRNSMYFDDYVDELVEDEEEDESEGESDRSSLDIHNVESAVPSRERVFLRLPTARSSATMHDAAKLPLHPADSPERLTGHNLSTDIDKAEQKEEEGGNVRLEAGIVDYCVMLGPSDPFSLLKPTHYVAPSGALASLPLNALCDGRGANSQLAEAPLTSPNSPLPSSPYTGLFGDAAATGESAEEQEIIIWDRLPRHDYFDLEMPSKLEWFACPEGSKTVLCHRRPDPYYQSFVLSSGGESEEVYGLSINFFLQLNGANSLESMLRCSSQQSPRSEGEDAHPPSAMSAWWRAARNINPNENSRELLHDRKDSNNSIRYNSVEDKFGTDIGGNETDSLSLVQEPKLWTVVSLCLLFRASHHVQQLRKCLEYAYYESILSNLNDWESRWEAQVREVMCGDDNPSSALTPSSPGLSMMPLTSKFSVSFNALDDSIKFSAATLKDKLIATFRSSFKPFSLHIEKLMATLCLECPVPIPGYLNVKLVFPKKLPDSAYINASDAAWMEMGTPRIWKGGRDRDTAASAGVLQKNPENLLKSVEFTAPSPEDFPRCSYPLEVLLKCFGPRVLIDVVCCVLSECRMLFHSSDLALLPVICEGLRTLIYPLQWTHVYLPVVPMHLLNVVEAPVPFMLGTHSKWLKYIQADYMNDMVLIDCDTAAIDMGGSLALQFPEREDRWLMLALKSILQPVLPSHDVREVVDPVLGRLARRSLVRSKLDPAITRVDTDTRIQLVFYDVLFHLLRYVPDCLFYLNPSCPVFNRPLFISDYASDEYRACLELITVTNCFHVLTESIHTPSLAFFYKSIVRLTELEKNILDQTIAAEGSGKLGGTVPGGDSPSFSGNSSSQTNLIAPSPGGRGLRRTNSGSRAFTRNVSVANIIYDKLLNNAPTPVAPSTLDMAAVDDTGGKSEVPVAVQHTGRGLMRHISIMGLSETPKLDNTARSFYGAPGASVIGMLSYECPNEAAYASLLPPWLLKPTNEGGNGAPRKVDSIRALLNSRIKHYLPHLCMAGDKSTAELSLTPKGSTDSLVRLSSTDSSKAPSASHLITISCDYAVKFISSEKITTENTTPQVSGSANAVISTPIGKNRNNLPRSGSSSATVNSRTSGPGSQLKLRTKSTSTMSSQQLSLPVLTTIPSFRLPSSQSPTPSSPLSRLFQTFPEAEYEASEDRNGEQSKVKVHRSSERDSALDNLPEDDAIGFDSFHQNTSSSDTGSKHHSLDSPFSAFSNKSVKFAHSDVTPLTHPPPSPPPVQEPTPNSEVVYPEKGGPPDRGPEEATILHGIAPEPGSSIAEYDKYEKTCEASAREEEDKFIYESDPAPSEVLPLRPLIEFDTDLLATAQEQVTRWTIADLARELQLPTAAVLQTYNKLRSLVTSKLGENTQFAARHRAINAGAKQNKRLLNPASAQATVDKLGKMGDQQCDECITMFLQKVVTENILEEHWLEGAVQRCIKALQDKNNRRCLIDMLKNAKQTKDRRQAVANVYPLNSTAFEAFSKLFSGLLRICSNQEDYLCAYGLLEVGGLYFRLVVRDHDEESETMGEQDDFMEFLSERTCQHPIYHNSALWCELMKSRVSVPAASTQAQNKTNPRSSMNAVLSEVHSLLFIMLELEVNSARALLFIQGVASDYGLGINDYYKLQRFVNRIWTNNHVDECAALTEHDHASSVGGLHRPEAIKKKRSKETLRDRRMSMSIGDIVTMQGHNTSKLFRQGSMEATRGVPRSSSMKIRTAESAAEISTRSGRSVRRGSMGSIDEGDNFGTNEGVGLKTKRRARSMHAASFSLSIDTTADTLEPVEGESGKFRGIPARQAATPIHRTPLHDIDEHHDGEEDLSRISDHAVRSAMSTSNSRRSDSDPPAHSPSSGTDISTSSSPRVDSARSATTTSGPASHSFYADDTKSLDEMLGLQRVSSAMLMRTNSQTAVVKSPGTVLVEPSKNLPNKFAPLELTGRDEVQVTAFDCVDSWLVAGSEDGNVNITDLATGECCHRFRHGSGSGDRYRGITSIHCMSVPCPGSQASLFFSGCSNGMLKAWSIPVDTSRTPSTLNQPPSSASYWGIRMHLRLKQSLAVMKAHTAPVTCLTARPLDAPAGWLLASGDDHGLVCLSRGSEKSSTTTCCSSSIRANLPKSGGASERLNSALSNGKVSISCLAFIGAPTAVSGGTFSDAAAGVVKMKGTKKTVNASGGAAVTAGAGTGSEDYLGVGTSTGLISVLDLATAHPIYQVVGHAGKVTQIIGLHSNEFISCSMDRSIKLWDIRTRNRPTQNFAGKILEERSLGPASHRRCAASPITAIAVGGGDSSLVVSTSADGVVRLWDRRYDVNVPCSVTQGHSNRITAIGWNGVDEFHTASHDGTVRTWDSINGQNTHTLQAFADEGITGMKMTTFRCAQHVTITPRGPVTFTDHDKMSTRTCLITRGWNGTIKAFVHDV